MDCVVYRILDTILIGTASMRIVSAKLSIDVANEIDCDVTDTYCINIATYTCMILIHDKTVIYKFVGMFKVRCNVYKGSCDRNHRLIAWSSSSFSLMQTRNFLIDIFNLRAPPASTYRVARIILVPINSE